MLAESLGIKPGSKEFHALKQEQDLHNDEDKDDKEKNKVKNKVKGKGIR